MAGRWVRGQSGNPAGASKKRIALAKLAQGYSTEAIERLVELMRDKKAKHVALRAAEIILERAYGKVPQAITGANGEGPVKIAYEVSWKHSEEGGVTLDLKPNKEPLLIGNNSEEEDYD